MSLQPMIEAMRKAKSLSYVSHYTWEEEGKVVRDCTYRAWLKKPNYFRVEAEASASPSNEQYKGQVAAEGY